MAENLDSQPFGNFSIQNTMEMGMGNAELLNDLMGPDSATSNPDEIQDIDNTPAPEKKTTKAPAKADVTTTSTEEASPVDEKKSLTDFLMGDDKEEEEEVDNQPVKKASTLKEPTAAATTEDGEEEAEGDTNQFTALSKDLYKLGVFSKEDDEEDAPINNAEEFPVIKWRGLAQSMKIIMLCVTDPDWVEIHKDMFSKPDTV